MEPNVWQQYKDQDLVVIGLNPGGLFGADSDTIMTQFQEQSGITFPIGRTTNRSYSNFTQGSSVGSISPFPLDVVIDKKGNIAYLSREYEPAELQRIIEIALAQRP